MMDESRITRLLEGVRDGRVSIEEALENLAGMPFEDLGFARIDFHRSVRRGFPEVVFCQGKEPAQAAAIVERMVERGCEVLASRATRETYEAIRNRVPQAAYHPASRAVTVEHPDRPPGQGVVTVVSAGTSDIPIAEEAAITARLLGADVRTLFDVGVAGLHRLLHSAKDLREANVVVVVAGMEGALASVVSGLVSTPVVAVPTSIGYGASFGGLAALLGMLNSCSAGVVVVNIDNGFGGGYAAGLINRLAVRNRKEKTTAEEKR